MSSSEQITDSLTSRWSLRCLNIVLGGNSYSILAGRKDTYYVAVSTERKVLVSDE